MSRKILSLLTGTAVAAAAAVVLVGPPSARGPEPAPPAAAAPRGEALRGAAPRRDSLRITDDRGRTLVFARPPERIVSLIPPVTELLFALGAGNRLVGRTRFGVHPAEAREVPSVGDGVRPSVELVVGRRPDLVILFEGTSNAASLAQLERLGIPTLAVGHDGFPDLDRNLERLGRLTGRARAADSLRQHIRERLRRVARLTSHRRRRRVYYDLWWQPTLTVGGGSHIDSLITVAGGRNVFDDRERASLPVSLEAVAARRPEVVLHPTDGGGADGDRTAPSERPGWDAIPAVADGRVRRVDADLTHRLGPRIGEAAARMAAAIHPELRGALRREGLLNDSSGSEPR